MSGTINTGETTELGENYNPPTIPEMVQYMDDLEERGVSAEAECHDCPATFEIQVLPEEQDDEPHVALCPSCTVEHLREKDLL